MARPKVLRPSDGGEIILKNVNPQVVETVKSILSGGSLGAPAEAPVEEAAPEAEEDLPVLAVSMYKSPVDQKWYTVQVRCNPESGSARVVSKEQHLDKETSKENFKILAGRHILV